MAELFRYAAFISYSSKDAGFARRLHRALESYGIPSSLGHFDLIGGGKKNRIYPVFRDREELPAGNLGERIEAALRASAALIVVCSPNAAASPWVQKEIEFFVGLGRRARIFAILAEAAPLTDANGADATAESFPSAFRGDALADQDALEPLAADARRGRDGFRNSWLKLVAGLVGVTPGQLIDRDRKRRGRQALFSSIGAVTIGFAMLISIVWVDTRNWRTDLSTYAERISRDEGPLAAAPFALAGLNGGEAIIPARSDRADATLAGIGGQRLVLDLPALQGLTGASVALSADGKILVTHDAANRLTLYNLARGGARTDLGVFHTLGEFNLTADGATLVTRDQGRLSLFDISRGAAKSDLGDISAGDTVQLSAAGKTLIISGQHRLTIVDLTRNRRRTDLSAQNFALASTGAFLVTVSETDHRGTLYELPYTGVGIDLGIVGAPGAIAGFQFSEDGSSLVIQNADYRVSLHNLASGAVTDLGSLGPLLDFKLSADGKFLFTESPDHRGTVYDLERRRPPLNLGDLGELWRFFFADNDKMLVAVRSGIWRPDQGPLYRGTIYDLVQGGARTDLGDLDQLGDLQLSADGRTLVTRGLDHRGTLYDLAHKAARIDLGDLGAPEHFGAFGLSSDGAFLIVQSQDHRGTLYDIAHGGRRTDLGDLVASMALTSVVFSADGKTLVTRGADNRGAVYNLGDPVWIGEQPSGAALSAAVCDASGDALRPFPEPLRGRAERLRRASTGQTTNDKNLMEILYGRPWNPCDWRGLGAAPEGWAQFWRRIQVVFLGHAELDYKCGEVNAAGDTSMRRIQMCEWEHVPGNQIAELSRTLSRPR